MLRGRQYPDLFKVYYDANVLEYCGLITRGIQWRFSPVARCFDPA